MKAKAATLKDVAREAGFSVMTVSHVLNGNKLNHASPENRERIRAAAERLHYRPNLTARRLVTRKSNVIGLLIDSDSPQFYREVMTIIEHLAAAEGFRLQVGMLHNSLESIRQYAGDFAGSGVDSVICMAHSYPEFGSEVPALFELFKHVVFLEEPLTPTRFPVVGADHYANYLAAATGLLERGRRRIFCIRSAYCDRAFYAARNGLRTAYEQFGTPFEEQFWWLCETEWWRSAEQTEKMLVPVLAQRPDALVVGNDESMFWTLRVLHWHGIQVPRDIALFSAELGPHAAAAMPSFSGFDYDAEHLGREIFARLRSQWSQEALPGSPLGLFPAHIVWGESSQEGNAR